MNTTEGLFARWMVAKGHTSARSAARALGVSHQAPTHWKQGHNAAAHVVERMAKDLGDDPTTHLIRVFQETAKGKDVATLARLAKRLGVTAVLAAALMVTPQPGTTAELGNNAHGVDIMRSNRRRRRHKTSRPPIRKSTVARGWPRRRNCAAFLPREFADGTAALPRARSTDERLCPQRVRVRD